MKKHVVITFRQSGDPSPQETKEARELVGAIKGARLLNEIPGTLHVEVSSRALQHLANRLEALDSWQLSEEGAAQMPIEGGGNRKIHK